MATFAYTARNQRGELITGQINAASSDSAAQQVAGLDLIPISIEKGAESIEIGNQTLSNFFQKKVSLEDLILFSRQMYSLTKAGVPITRAMRGLSTSIHNPRLKKILIDMADGLESGVNLSTCLSQHPTVFNNLFVSLIRVGEESGKLDESFKKAAECFDLERTTRRRLKSATRYPSIVVGFVFVAIGVINYFVIPAFAMMFAKFHAQLPWQTRLLMSMSDFTVQYGVYILIGVAAGTSYFLHYIKTPIGLLRWDGFILKIPIIGSILLRITLGRFARTLSMMMRSGVPIISSLHTVSQALGNEFIAQHVHGMSASIERGETLPQAAANTGIFSPLVLQMLAVGEETGDMDDMLDEVADFFEEEVDYDLNRMTELLEPIMIGIIGVLVLILALGVFLPMWDLSSVALHKQS